MSTYRARSGEQWRTDIVGATSNGNRLCGRVSKSGRFWLAEIPSLEAATQGMTEDDAYAMVKDMLETLVNIPGFSVSVSPTGNGAFDVTSTGLDPLDLVQSE